MKDKTYIVRSMTLSDFKTEVETFLEETGVSPSRLGRAALKDPCFVFGLRNGAEPREATRKKVCEEMRKLREAVHNTAA